MINRGLSPVIRIIVVLSVVLLISPITSQADEYLLVMSKEDQVCQHVWSLYNKDLKDHGKLILENHEEYSWLKWNKNITIVGADGHSTYVGNPILKLAVFDINNDRKDETVIFARSSLSSILRDELDIYPYSVSLNLENLNWPELNKIKYANISGGGDYQLKELPPQHDREFYGERKKYYIDISDKNTP